MAQACVCQTRPTDSFVVLFSAALTVSGVEHDVKPPPGSRTDDPDVLRARLHVLHLAFQFHLLFSGAKIQCPKMAVVVFQELNMLFVAWTSRRRFTPVTLATVKMKSNSATKSLHFKKSNRAASGEQRGSDGISIFIYFFCIIFTRLKVFVALFKSKHIKACVCQTRPALYIYIYSML